MERTGYYVLVNVSTGKSCIHMATSFSKSIELSVKIGYYNFFSVYLCMFHLSVSNFTYFTCFNIILVLSHSYLFTQASYLSMVITRGSFYSDFREAISIEKRYFTSDLSNLS